MNIKRYKSMLKYGFDKTALGMYIFKKKWRNANPQNFMSVDNVFPIEQVTVGKESYGRLMVETYGGCDCHLYIGDYCSLAKNITFVLGGERDYKKLMNYPVDYYLLGKAPTALSKGDIVIENDVWIGYGCLIMSGVHIGQGAIIAAGSVVYKDVPAYGIYGDGKIIGYRFDEELREKLQQIDFSKIDREYIADNTDIFHENVQEKPEIIDRVLKQYRK